MRKTMMMSALLVLTLSLTGCTGVERALKEAGSALQGEQTQTNRSDETDWSYVPLVRDLATATFTEGFPDAVIAETSVGTRSMDSSRVIVTIEYELGGKSGHYGFEYQRNAQGEYALVRYGDGVSADDL